MTTMTRHFVTFYSPGTFVSEQTTKDIDCWDVEKAKEIAHEITERHSATPYAFRFSTRIRTDADLDSKESARSGFYYLGGRIETRAQVEARNDPNEEILRSNMRANNIDRAIINENSWRFTGAFHEVDTLLEWAPRRKPEAAKGHAA